MDIATPPSRDWASLRRAGVLWNSTERVRSGLNHGPTDFRRGALPLILERVFAYSLGHDNFFNGQEVKILRPKGHFRNEKLLDRFGVL